MTTVGEHDAPLTKDERSELTWLRAENELLRVERDILIRVATGYAKDMDILLQRRKPHPLHEEPRPHHPG